MLINHGNGLGEEINKKSIYGGGILKMDREIMGDILSIIFGLGILTFHKFMAKFATNMWLKRFNLNVSEKTYRIFFLSIGLILLIWGLASLLKTIK